MFKQTYIKKISIVININNYDELDLDKFTELLSNISTSKDIIIIFKFYTLDYNEDKLLDFIKNLNADYKNSNILFEFSNITYYEKTSPLILNQNLVKTIFKTNFNIVLLDINDTKSQFTINLEEYNEQYLEREIIYIKLYGPNNLYQGTYTEDKLNKIRNKFVNYDEEKEICYIFCNVETNTKNQLFIKKKNEGITKEDYPSSILNAIDLILQYSIE